MPWVILVADFIVSLKALDYSPFLCKGVCVCGEGEQLRCPAGGLAVWATQAEGHWHAAGSDCPVKGNELCKLQLTTQQSARTHTHPHTRTHTHAL